MPNRGADSTLKVGQVVTCGLCFHILAHPIVEFPCHHAFCHKCIASQLQSSSNDGAFCVLCNTTYKNINIGNLHHHHSKELEAYVELLSSGKEKPPLCQWCEEEDAIFQCRECMRLYCKDCDKAVHKNAAKRGHTSEKIKEEDARHFISFYKRCPQKGHEEYHAEFYCTDCEELCCAYCLKVGPHRDHREWDVTRAATEARQQLGSDLKVIAEAKKDMETQITELNRTSKVYFESYDSVESTITERFTLFKKQLMERELQLRSELMRLRETGDRSLLNSRILFLLKMNAMEEGLLRFRRLQVNSTDCEVLESKSLIGKYLKLNPPVFKGNGFKLSSLGDMMISGMDVNLDFDDKLQAKGVFSSQSAPRQSSSSVSRRSPPLRLTFPVDNTIQTTLHPYGVHFCCVGIPSPSETIQIGLRSKETFDYITRAFPEDEGIIIWSVRLDKVIDTFLGIVERVENDKEAPEGFYWKPAGSNVFDGSLGNPTPALYQLPTCRIGSVVTFTYKIHSSTISIEINGKDHGVILKDLHPHICPCFIFYPGEALTVMF